METKLLYFEDQYKKEAIGKATWHEFTDLIVDQTIFFPTSDGQPNDRGHVYIDGTEYIIVDTWSDGDSIHLMSHDTFPDDVNGKEVKQVLDWDVRYSHMRFRTALKILSGLAYKMYGATMRINQTYDDTAWVDLELDEISKEQVDELFAEANKIAKTNVDTNFTTMSREDFMKNDELMKICKKRVPDYEEIRVLHLEGIPDQMDFGTNVKNTSEIGEIEFKTNLVKGKISRRINITLK